MLPLLSRCRLSRKVARSSLLVFCLHSSIVYTSFFFFLTRLVVFSYILTLSLACNMVWLCISRRWIIPLQSRWYSFVSRLSDHPSLTGVVLSFVLLSSLTRFVWFHFLHTYCVFDSLSDVAVYRIRRPL